MTELVQSSRAVIVASIGFVNAGLISMRQALGIIYGLNLGTTMTGWLVALLGFKFDIQVSGVAIIKGNFNTNVYKPIFNNGFSVIHTDILRYDNCNLCIIMIIHYFKICL
jgi:hypothetical protein